MFIHCRTYHYHGPDQKFLQLFYTLQFHTKGCLFNILLWWCYIAWGILLPGLNPKGTCHSGCLLRHSQHFTICVVQSFINHLKCFCVCNSIVQSRDFMWVCPLLHLCLFLFSVSITACHGAPWSPCVFMLIVDLLSQTNLSQIHCKSQKSDVLTCFCHGISSVLSMINSDRKSIQLLLARYGDKKS